MPGPHCLVYSEHSQNRLRPDEIYNSEGECNGESEVDEPGPGEEENDIMDYWGQ